MTGEVWPVRELPRVARDRDARTVLDAAQLAPHRPVRITELDLDYVAVSGHKLYAPFGAGALIGREAGAESERAVRVSVGLGTTVEHVDRFVTALRGLVEEGPVFGYEIAEGRWVPSGDTRELPAFLR